MAVVFVDAVQHLRAHLLTVFPDVQFVSKVPNPRPDEFVLLRRVGGPTRNMVTDEPTLAVEAWSTDKTLSQALLQRVRAAIHEAPTASLSPPIYLVTEFAGPADLPDPDSNHARHTMTVAVAMRGDDSVAL